MEKYTDKDLRLKLQKAIDEMMAIIEDPESDANKKGYAANTMNGLIKTYKDKFNVAPDKEAGMRSVKNF